MGQKNEGSRPEDTVRRLRSLSRGGRARVCPHCANPTLNRLRLPFYLRPLRLVGLSLKAYRCSYCGHGALKRDRRHAGRRASKQ
jgi:ribosomal protein L37E